MVVIKSSLTLPSLGRANSSRSSSPAPSPTMTPNTAASASSTATIPRSNLGLQATVSDSGVKRTPLSVSMLDALPKSRSRSGESKKRSSLAVASHSQPVIEPVHLHAHAASTHSHRGAATVANIDTNGVPLGLTVSSGGSGSAHSALRPKLASFLSGRTASATSSAVTSPTSAQGPLGHLKSGTVTPAQTPAPGMHLPVSSANVNNGALPAGPTPAAAAVAVGHLEASYVTKIGMTLAEAVNRVFPAANAAAVPASAGGAASTDVVHYKGASAPRVDKARDLGNIIASELHLAVADPYLLRSLLRSAVLKSLSIFMSRLEALLLPIAGDATLTVVARTLKEAETPPVAQRYLFLILRSAWEVKRGLLRACSTPSPTTPGNTNEQMPKFVKDTLGPWIAKIDLLANKYWSPILASIKDDIVKVVIGQGGTTPDNAHNLHGTTNSSTTSLTVPNLKGSSLARASTATGVSLLSTAYSISGHAVPTGNHGPIMPANCPVYLRDFGNFVQAAARTFAWLSTAGGPVAPNGSSQIMLDMEAQKWKVSIASTAIWKMLLCASSRRLEADGEQIRRRHSPPPAKSHTAQSGHAHSHATGSGVHSPAIVSAPAPRRSVSAMGIGRLRPSSSGKRSPSPPLTSSEMSHAQLLIELEAFEGVIEKFVSSLIAGGSLHEAGSGNSAACEKGKDCRICKGRFIPLDVDDSDDEEALPREAMQEALTALSSFIVLIRGFACLPDPAEVLLHAALGVDDVERVAKKGICPNLIRALDTAPPLILLQTIVSHIPAVYGIRAPHELWNTTWRDYEQTMKGFHTGEEWVAEVGWELLKEVKRAERRSSTDDHVAGDASTDGDHHNMLSEREEWLKLLKVAVTELADVEDLPETDSGIKIGNSVRA